MGCFPLASGREASASGSNRLLGADCLDQQSYASATPPLRRRLDGKYPAKTRRGAGVSAQS